MQSMYSTTVCRNHKSTDLESARSLFSTRLEAPALERITAGRREGVSTASAKSCSVSAPVKTRAGDAITIQYALHTRTYVHVKPVHSVLLLPAAAPASCSGTWSIPDFPLICQSLRKLVRPSGSARSLYTRRTWYCSPCNSPRMPSWLRLSVFAATRLYI